MYVHLGPFASILQVKAMVQGRDRRPELGYAWALECRKGIFYPPKNKNSRHNHLSDFAKMAEEKAGQVANKEEKGN